ncbi:MAG TPA: tyrosine-protein phosphatase [Bryobacteraceae bacterium]|jgi:protein-tyrosine phosphatase|nr:tyrosine-protein phosphatase [Bryobacteraceae bacterium]
MANHIGISVLFAFFCGVSARAADGPAIHIRNFSQVNDHLYRGGQPTSEGFQQLATAKISLVIDLREPSEGTEAERRLVQSLGMQYLDVPLPRLSAPSPAQIKRVLSLLVPDDNGRVFVHCWRGKDRTGTVIACYRIQHDGWTPRRALEEASHNGMSGVEHSMRTFILRFQPEDLPAAALFTRPSAGN